MSKPVLIIGGGGHARVIADALQLSGIDVLGILDQKFKPGSAWYHNLMVLGDDELITTYDHNEVMLANGLGYMPKNFNRRNIFNTFNNRNYNFINAIHPKAIVARDVDIGKGVQILAGAVVNSGARLGDNCIINSNAIVEHDCIIHAHSHIAPGAIVCGNSHLGESVFVGAGAVIIQDQAIEKETIIPANHTIRSSKKTTTPAGGHNE